MEHIEKLKIYVWSNSGDVGDWISHMDRQIESQIDESIDTIRKIIKSN
jgi:hypothetical protein